MNTDFALHVLIGRLNVTQYMVWTMPEIVSATVSPSAHLWGGQGQTLENLPESEKHVRATTKGNS